MRHRLLRALARHAKLICWLAVLGWLAWIAGALATRQPLRSGWLGMLFFIVVSAALLAAWAGSWQRMAIRESALPMLPRRRLRQQFPALTVKDADLVERGFR